MMTYYRLRSGIALIGDPKLIFLDEPTAGVDPYSRRHMWSVLKKRKEGKVRKDTSIIFFPSAPFSRPACLYLLLFNLGNGRYITPSSILMSLKENDMFFRRFPGSLPPPPPPQR
jgi:hypothetical protein